MLKQKNLVWRITIMCMMVLCAFYICFGFFPENPLIDSEFVCVNERNLSVDLQLEEKRAIYLTVQTDVSHGWCRMQASALLSGISVVSLGFGEKYSHTIRPSWILQYLEAKNLDDSHVLVFMDGVDTFFTSGDTMKKAVTNFIKTTAETADKFDSKAVLEGNMSAPFLFGAEEDCWGADIWYLGHTDGTLCKERYSRAYKSSNYAFYSKNNEIAEQGITSYRYLNAGIFISRVWAFKMAAKIFNARLATRNSVWCDQSVWTSVFLDSTVDNSCTSEKLCAPRGMISLDFKHNYFIYPYGSTFLDKSYRPWNQSTIHHYMSTRNPPFPHFFDLADNRDATPGAIHFPGWRKSFADDISRFLPTTAWVQEAHRDGCSIKRSTEYLSNKAIVKVYSAHGEEGLLMYGDFCSADDVMDKKWLRKIPSKG